MSPPSDVPCIFHISVADQKAWSEWGIFQRDALLVPKLLPYEAYLQPYEPYNRHTHTGCCISWVFCMFSHLSRRCFLVSDQLPEDLIGC